MRAEDHVPYRQLVDLHDGVLAGRRLAAAREHVGDGCVVCRERVRRIAATVGALRAGPLEDAPTRVVRDAVALYAQVHGDFVWPPDELLGTLVLDRRDELVAGVRSAPGGVRQLLWTVGDAYELDASVVARAAGADLLGQIVPSEDDPEARLDGHVAAFRGGAEVERVALGGDGRFTFRALAAGAWTLRGEVDGRRFRLPPVIVD